MFIYMQCLEIATNYIVYMFMAGPTAWDRQLLSTTRNSLNLFLFHV